MATLSVEDLFNISDAGLVATTRGIMRELLVRAQSVAAFLTPTQQFTPPTPHDAGLFEDAAAALVCSSIARAPRFDFSRTVKMTESDNLWNALLRSERAQIEARRWYDLNFGVDATAGASSFNDYMPDRDQWAAQLASHVTTDAFLNVLVNKLIIHEAGWLHTAQLTLYKLNLLNAGACDRVYKLWTGRQVPGIGADWSKRVYTYEPDFRNDEYINEVNAAIERNKVDRHSDGRGKSYSTTTYGPEVENFVNTKAAALGLATGNHPSNSFDSSPSRGCFLAGTTVLLAGGRSKRIEEVSEGDLVIAQNGELSERSDERVRIELGEPLTIYGINDVAPFFSPGHLFLTTDGWKAIDPAIALEENPTGRTVGRLGVGDVVERVVGIEPFRYERIRIERFTTRLLDAGDAIYGLHLLGARSYHANGFCVAMNYPLITAKRLIDGFAKLTEDERRLLAHQLEPVLPLLCKAIGSFVEAPLRRALETVKEEAWN